MKKLLALLLMLVLSASPALGEGIEARPAYTITAQTSVDTEAAKNAIAQAGLKPGTAELLEGLLGLMSNSSEKLVIADQGIEYQMTFSDGQSFNLAMESDEGGAAVVSSLIPHYRLIGEEGVTWDDAIAAALEIEAEYDQAQSSIEAAIAPGEIVEVKNEIDGEVYTRCAPLSVDVKAIYDASRALFEDPSLEALGIYPKDLSEDALPAVTAQCYTNDAGVSLYTAEFIPALSEEAALFLKVRADGEAFAACVDTPDDSLKVTLNYTPAEKGFDARAELQIGKMTFAAEATAAIDQTSTMTIRYYAFDMETPVATETTMIIPGGTRTIDPRQAELTPIAIEDIQTNKNDAVMTLFGDIIISGLTHLPLENLTEIAAALP